MRHTITVQDIMGNKNDNPTTTKNNNINLNNRPVKHTINIGLVLMITPAFKWIPNIFSLPAADTMKYDMVNEFCLASSA